MVTGFYFGSSAAYTEAIAGGTGAASSIFPVLERLEGKFKLYLKHSVNFGFPFPETQQSTVRHPTGLFQEVDPEERLHLKMLGFLIQLGQI